MSPSNRHMCCYCEKNVFHKNGCEFEKTMKNKKKTCFCVFHGLHMHLGFLDLRQLLGVSTSQSSFPVCLTASHFMMRSHPVKRCQPRVSRHAFPELPQKQQHLLQVKRTKLNVWIRRIIVKATALARGSHCSSKHLMQGI